LIDFFIKNVKIVDSFDSFDALECYISLMYNGLFNNGFEQKIPCGLAFFFLIAPPCFFFFFIKNHFLFDFALIRFRFEEPSNDSAKDVQVAFHIIQVID